MNPEYVSATEVAQRFRTTRWSATLADAHGIYPLCDALIVAEDQL